ncbi:hypothetical protein [Melissococcus plutonius]|uniref:hypothetical protein n=1 Tax=Melissococcus plutonius TaxID=33970 RepID=UPI003C2B1B49
MTNSDTVFVRELSGENANDETNKYLQNGWKLINVFSKTIHDDTAKDEYLASTYVIGATQSVYESYIEELKNCSDELNPFEF